MWSSPLTGVAGATAGSRRVGSAPTLPSGAHHTGPLAGATVLGVDITLKPRDPAALTDYARSVTRRASRDDRRYLTVAQVRRRFGPTQAGVAAVRAALVHAGLPSVRVSTDGLLIRVRATAAQLDSGLGVELERVRLTDGRTVYANRRPPRFALDVAGLIQGVVGLDDLASPHPLGLGRGATRALTGLRGAGARAQARRAAAIAAAGSGTPVATAGCPATQLATQTGAYTPDEIASAYGFDSLYSAGDDGAGETVALMEYEEYATSDIEAFENCFTVNGAVIGGGDAADVHEISIDGGADAQGTNAQYGSGEAALDIEEILGVAPDANIEVYEVSDGGSDTATLDADNAMVENDTVDAISTSWGVCETALTESDPTLAKAENAIFEEAAAEGISVFAASGDEGSSACDGELGGAAADAADVEDPGSQPYVTSVGGTSLPSVSDPADQSVWNNSLGASGGGVSQLWAMPAYQLTAASTLPGIIGPDSSASACGTAAGSYCRETPDVSADADPDTGYTIEWKGNWYVIGGTSAAAPLWAGLTALADDSSACDGTTVGFANPVLYGIGANPTEYADDFNDVTGGNNARFSVVDGDFAATAGYDMATGLGTPRAATLVPDMCGEATALGTASTRVSVPPTWPTSGSGGSGGSGASGAGGGGSEAGSSGAGSSSGSESPTNATASAPATPVATAPVSPSGPVTAPSVPTQPTARASACTLTLSLHPGAVALALSRTRHHVTQSVAFREPGTTGCGSYALTLARHITTTERGGARARDTLKIELLNPAGKLIKTLTTLSGAQARRGYQTLNLNLGSYPGQRMTLRCVASRAGSATTAFSLRSLTLRAP